MGYRTGRICNAFVENCRRYDLYGCSPVGDLSNHGDSAGAEALISKDILP